jgi:hypothetical protein
VINGGRDLQVFYYTSSSKKDRCNSNFNPSQIIFNFYYVKKAYYRRAFSIISDAPPRVCNKASVIRSYHRRSYARL